MKKAQNDCGGIKLFTVKKPKTTAKAKSTKVKSATKKK